MSKKPKVSVCIASYNHACYLPAALDSVLEQTYHDFEVVVVDDGSSDNSLEILERYSSQDPKVRVFTHPNHSNMGIGVTTNFAIQQAQGSYISFIGSDDAWYPQKLERQVALMESDPQVGLTYSSTRIIDSDGQYITPYKIGCSVSPKQDLLSRSIRVNPVPALTAMVRRECFDQLGLYDESLIYNDWELWIRIMSRWETRFIDEPLAMYRIHGSNISVGINPVVHCQRNLDVINALSRKAVEVGGALASDRVRAILDLQAAYLNFYLDNLLEAATLLRMAFDKDISLRANADTLSDWLIAQKYEGTTPLPPATAERDFAAWFLASIPTTVTAAFARRIARRVSAGSFAHAALACHDAEPVRARQLLIKCFKNDPSRLIEGELRWVMMKTIVGDKAIGYLGRAKSGMLRSK